MVVFLMTVNYLHKEENKQITLYKIEDNKNGNLPVFVRKYFANRVTPLLHMHEYMQINYVSHGKGRHLINSREFDIVKGDIFVIPPYVPHRIIAIPGCEMEIYELEFVPDFINQNFVSIENAVPFLDFAYIEPFLVSENKVKPRLNLTGPARLEIENILNEILKEYEIRAPGYLLLIKSLLLKLLVLVGREFTKDLENEYPKMGSVFDRNRDAVLNAVKYIDEHYNCDISIEEVAHIFALSQSYFSYLFKSITSKTFTEYLNGLRISKAMEFLKNTDQRVLDISFDVGFNNINHFNRVFKQHTGISPVAYRKAL
jgi:AraC-like DNA-binding protein/mannose-6-phosphate isomerase-like protein (cupin superfamily)